uniref:Uncharacterized protein n=1 Tax=Romanomermis culicivorax TaxID=13658 RepID=A0A915KNT6_ROMCU
MFKAASKKFSDDIAKEATIDRWCKLAKLDQSSSLSFKSLISDWITSVVHYEKRENYFSVYYRYSDKRRLDEK